MIFISQQHRLNNFKCTGSFKGSDPSAAACFVSHESGFDEAIRRWHLQLPPRDFKQTAAGPLRYLLAYLVGPITVFPCGTLDNPAYISLVLEQNRISSTALKASPPGREKLDMDETVCLCGAYFAL